MKRKIPVLPIAFGVVAIILVAAVLFAPSGTDYFGSPDVAGETLPTLQGGGTDPAVGIAAPNVVGADFAGDEVAIPSPGKGTVLLFLAHWCPHCQAEVPRVVQLIESGGQPDGLDVYGVSTSVDASRGGAYPPAAWFEREGFDVPVIRDNANNDAFNFFGGGGFPYAIYVDSDNNIVARSSGELDPTTIQSIWEIAAGEVDAGSGSG